MNDAIDKSDGSECAIFEGSLNFGRRRQGRDCLLSTAHVSRAVSSVSRQAGRAWQAGSKNTLVPLPSRSCLVDNFF